MMEVRLATARRKAATDDEAPANTYIVAPGDIIAAEAGFMRSGFFHSSSCSWLIVFRFAGGSGHGTFMDGDDLVACVPGVVETVNKLIRVRPFRSRSRFSLL
jgi:exosome complex RNA-binding protein Rrp4